MKQEVKKTFFATSDYFKEIRIENGSFVFEFNPGLRFHSAEWKKGTAFFEENDFVLNDKNGFLQEFTCKDGLVTLNQSCKLVCVHLFSDGKSALQGVDNTGFGDSVAAFCFFRSCQATKNEIKSGTIRSALDFDIKKSKVITYEQVNITLENEPN